MVENCSIIINTIFLLKSEEKLEGSKCNYPTKIFLLSQLPSSPISSLFTSFSSFISASSSYANRPPLHLFSVNFSSSSSPPVGRRFIIIFVSGGRKPGSEQRHREADDELNGSHVFRRPLS